MSQWLAWHGARSHAWGTGGGLVMHGLGLGGLVMHGWGGGRGSHAWVGGMAWHGHVPSANNACPSDPVTQGPHLPNIHRGTDFRLKYGIKDGRNQLSTNLTPFRAHKVGVKYICLDVVACRKHATGVSCGDMHGAHVGVHSACTCGAHVGVHSA